MPDDRLRQSVLRHLSNAYRTNYSRPDDNPCTVSTDLRHLYPRPKNQSVAVFPLAGRIFHSLSDV